MMTEDDILKEELMQGIDLMQDNDLMLEAKQWTKSEGESYPVYKKLAGLTNLGRTYFINWSEVKSKNDWAQTQMTNLYGAELYGIDAQLKNQQKDGQGSEVGDGKSSLITCRVSTLMQLPKDGRFMKEASDNRSFKQEMDDFIEFMDSPKGEDFKKNNPDAYNRFVKLADEFNYSGDYDDEKNQTAWKNMQQELKKEPWKSLLVKGNALYDRFKRLDRARAEWSSGGYGRDGEGFFGRTGNNVGSAAEQKGFTPRVTCRIDVSTHFDANWFKRKFKSGILNKMIMAVKTDAMSHFDNAAKKNVKDADHKYTADEMLPEDERKLERIQWKMTNKVANDYIRLLLGWTRTKQKHLVDNVMMPVQEELSQDEAFGKEMAKKALGNRGVLGRLKQKLFSGQQSSNVITVAFQLADPDDGWEVVPSPNGQVDVAPEAGENPAPDSSSDFGPEWEGIGQKASELAPRVEKLEQGMVSEEHDPFAYGMEIDPCRTMLLENVCRDECGEGDVDSLIEDCL